jgi:integrase
VPVDLLADLVRLAALTGLRQGELRALKWGDLDFSGQRITVARTAGQDTPKSGQARTIPMSDQAVVIFDRLNSGRSGRGTAISSSLRPASYCTTRRFDVPT